MTAAAVVALLVAVLVLTMRTGLARGPAAPYDHRPLSEVSVATEDVVAGQASTVTDGLRERGYWCVQPRSNDRAAQITCQAPQGNVRVDVVAAPGGDVLYADIDLRTAAAQASSRDVQEDLSDVLDATFLTFWPQDRRTVQDLLEDARPHPFLPFGGAAPPDDPAKQEATHDRRTGNASWSLRSRYDGRPLTVQVRTEGLDDHSWPFGGSHYATSAAAARTDLAAAGFSCATSCWRASDGQTIDFEEHDGQIIVARLTLRRSADGDRSTDLAGQWPRAGLPFLTPEVRAAVGRRLEQCQIERQSWHGVVAGTPVEAVAVPGVSSTTDGRSATDLVVTIGVRLLPSS